MNATLLPADASPQQIREVEAGEGGELAPLMCVDRNAADLVSFEALSAEAAAAGPPWALVFTAALAGRGGCPPSVVETDAALQAMVDSIKAGRIQGLLPFSRAGLPVQLS